MNTAFAPEYQGPLRDMPVNASYQDVLATARNAAQAARASGSGADLARARLAEAEACRRLGEIEEAEVAWRDSYRTARGDDALDAMAWALWSGGTLARQRGRFALARRCLTWSATLAQRANDVLASGYARAGLAETGRIQGDYAEVLPLHRELLAEARERDEPRHIVWALEGLAQIHRHTGDPAEALEMFAEAAWVAEAAGDRRGHAWAQRGRADLLSLRGETARALELLTDGERSCREMSLSSALAYNHKMRANVLLRAGRCAEASEVYAAAWEEFRAIGEPRGEALARLGLIKSRSRAGRDPGETDGELRKLRADVAGSGLHALLEAIDRARADLASTAVA